MVNVLRGRNNLPVERTGRSLKVGHYLFCYSFWLEIIFFYIGIILSSCVHQTYKHVK